MAIIRIKENERLFKNLTNKPGKEKSFNWKSYTKHIMVWHPKKVKLTERQERRN